MTALHRIEGQRCGCDDGAVADKLTSIDAALRRIASRVKGIDGYEEVSLYDAVGRVLVETVQARADVPPFDNAAMDGYAVNSATLCGNGPWQLEITQRIAAGQSDRSGLSVGAAMQIFTGAPIPQGADAVVMQEHVQRTDRGIVVKDKVRPGAHIRKAGEDSTAGTCVLPSGHRLTPRGIATCAAAGYQTVRVRRRVRVGLLVTGDEVQRSGRALRPAGIWDVNSPMLQSELTDPSLHLFAVQAAGDDRQSLLMQVAALAKTADLIVTTGGISVGEEDHVRPVMAQLGADFLFSRVAMKTGKPVTCGRLGESFWVGLPGNPLSALLTWRLFGVALCRSLSGDQERGMSRRHVVLERALHHKPGRCELWLARCTGFDGKGREVVSFDSATHSARIACLPQMDGVVFIPADVDHLPAGALAEFQPFDDR